jgi:hypothetical protein
MITGGRNVSKPLLLRNNSVPYPHQKTQGLPHAKFIEEAYSKREPVQNPRLRYFKPFQFFDHTGACITLTTAHENIKPGTIKLYFATSDVAAAHQELSAKGAKVNEVKDDLFGRGSGVKWLNLQDPDGNPVLLVQV